MSGGQQDNLLLFDEMWNLNQNTLEWTFVTTPGALTPGTVYSGKRFSHGSFTIDSTQEYCVFGGLTQKGPLNDLWCFDLSGLMVRLT